MSENSDNLIGFTNFDLLVSVTGINVGRLLCRHFGGRDLYIPPDPNGKAGRLIVSKIGEAAATVLFKATVLGDAIYIPKKPFSRKKRRVITLSYVAKRLREGARNNQIATELKVSARTVGLYRSELRRHGDPMHRMKNQPDSIKEASSSVSNASLTGCETKIGTSPAKNKESRLEPMWADEKEL